MRRNSWLSEDLMQEPLVKSPSVSSATCLEQSKVLQYRAPLVLNSQKSFQYQASHAWNSQKSFQYQAPLVWNTLPAQKHNTTALSAFKPQLKSFLFQTTSVTPLHLTSLWTCYVCVIHSDVTFGGFCSYVLLMYLKSSKVQYDLCDLKKKIND